MKITQFPILEMKIFNLSIEIFKIFNFEMKIGGGRAARILPADVRGVSYPACRTSDGARVRQTPTTRPDKH